MQLINCTEAEHAHAILAIFNEAIANTTAVYEYEPRPAAAMQQWFDSKRKGAYPVLGMVHDDGTLLGFASYGSFRDRPAYKYAVEHSVYVHKDHRGRGIGRILMQHLISVARGQQYHTLVAGIDLGNSGSIALHEKLGFRHVGTLPQTGFKFGRWLDLAFYQLILDTPAQPVGG